MLLLVITIRIESKELIRQGKLTIWSNNNKN